jgi:predicted amidophosphoribosyltransferase
MTAYTKKPTICNCDNCDCIGHVERQHGKYIHMICPNCEKKWRTHSELCSTCNKPNGFAFPGTCGTCYSERQELL